MLKIRRPLGRLIFNMGIAIPGKTVFLIETAPWLQSNGSYPWQLDVHCWGPYWVLNSLETDFSRRRQVHSRRCPCCRKSWLIPTEIVNDSTHLWYHSTLQCSQNMSRNCQTLCDNCQPPHACLHNIWKFLSNNLYFGQIWDTFREQWYYMQ